MIEKAVFQIVGYKNSGKTTLICKLIEQLKYKGIRVGVIKHDAHDFELDPSETDTWKQRKAGADVVANTSASRTAIIKEYPSGLSELIDQLQEVDLILVEGFKFEGYAKLVMIRDESDWELIDMLDNVKIAAIGPNVQKLDLKHIPVCSIQNDAFVLQFILNLYAKKRIIGKRTPE